MAGYIGNFPTAIPLSGTDIADGTITNSDLANSSITVNGTSIDLGASGNISAGITEADQWRLTANHAGTGDIDANLERVDTAGFGYLGTGMTESSGIFTFPSTGIYKIEMIPTSNSGSTEYYISTTVDNSTYVQASYCQAGGDRPGYIATFIFDVTNTSTHKVKFNKTVETGVTVGDTNKNKTYFTFIRIGDT